MVIVRDDYERQASLLGMDYEAKLDEYQAVYLYYIELAEKQGARIAELEAQLAEAKPRIRKAETGIRGGLLKGRIRQKGVRDPSQVRPTFDAALQMATTDDLMWALELLIKHPHTKRTWRDHRIKHIDARLREILAAVQP
jgi:thioredoxin-like negative regulator of GroEL